APGFIVDMHADDVARHEVGRPLYALELPAEDPGQGLREQRLAESRNALHQNVPARDQGERHGADRVFGADDDARQLALEEPRHLSHRTAHPPICLMVCTIALCSRRRGTRRPAYASVYQLSSSATAPGVTRGCCVR